MTAQTRAEEPSFWDVINDCKNLFTKKITDAKNELTDKFAPTAEDNKNLETVKNGVTEQIKKVAPVVKTGLLDPIKDIAQGTGKDRDPEKLKKQEKKKQLNALKAKLLLEEQEDLEKKLKPYYPTPESSPDELLTLIKNADDFDAEKLALSGELKKIEERLDKPRNGGKTAILAAGSLLCGVSIGTLTYAITKKLFKNCSLAKIKRKQAKLKSLTAIYDELNKKITLAQGLLNKKDIETKKEQSAKKFLKKKTPVLQKLKTKIFWKKLALAYLRTKHTTGILGVPIISATAAIAGTLACVNLWPSIWPQTTPPSVATTPEEQVKSQNSLTLLRANYVECQEKYKKLEATGKTITRLPPEIQKGTLQWKEIQRSVEDLNKQNKQLGHSDKNSGGISEVANVIVNTIFNPQN